MFSILIPSYNNLEYLKLCLKSIICKQYLKYYFNTINCIIDYYNTIYVYFFEIIDLIS